MMKRFLFFVIAVFTITVVSCAGKEKKEDDNKDKSVVSIKTGYGEIKVKLYDDTPLHKKNFLKLVNEGFYDGLIFHRVIEHFMIQGGDPHSRNPRKNIMYGGGGPGYTIPSEIKPNHFHKRGALAAARRGGKSNPEKRSSGSQFYIVQGEVYTEGALDTMEIIINQRLKDELLKDSLDAITGEIIEFKKKDDREGFNMRYALLKEHVDSVYATKPQFKFTAEQRKIYTTIGGYPSLDREYTVFGEVIEGFDVLDSIAAVETDSKDRPKDDILMELKQIQ